VEILREPATAEAEIGALLAARVVVQGQERFLRLALSARSAPVSRASPRISRACPGAARDRAPASRDRHEAVDDLRALAKQLEPEGIAARVAKDSRMKPVGLAATAWTWIWGSWCAASGTW